MEQLFVDIAALSRLTKPALMGLLPTPCLFQDLTLVDKKMPKASMLELVGGEAVITFLGTWYPCQVPPPGSQVWSVVSQERSQEGCRRACSGGR